ncbi:hypothetical protein BDZ97DRAFT_2078825 [Flammula alnicola]|nr:hypothetical protein BDZ97DRAFT_2078825 [Flammula alnicola]
MGFIPAFQVMRRGLAIHSENTISGTFHCSTYSCMYLSRHPSSGRERTSKSDPDMGMDGRIALRPSSGTRPVARRASRFFRVFPKKTWNLIRAGSRKIAKIRTRADAKTYGASHKSRTELEILGCHVLASGRASRDRPMETYGTLAELCRVP